MVTPQLPVKKCEKKTMLNRLVLVLNKGYMPVNVISARRAFTLIFKGAAKVVTPSSYFIRTGLGTKEPIPSVIRLENYNRVPKVNRTLSRKNIFLRDRHRCQYCLRSFTSNQLTLDHVIPSSRGGKHDWGNVVAACFPCNNRKSDRTPDEAGMPLAHKPARIGIHGKHRLMADAAEDPAWEPYLFF
jgi:hypothetical protein